MAVPEKTRVTIQEFDEFINWPENADKLFEYIGGEIVEVLSRPYASSLAATINYHFGSFTRNEKPGHITGKRGGYAVSGEHYHPDVAFISKQQQPELPKEGYVPNPPDLAVEILSPGIENNHISIKVANYLAAGTVVWRIRPEEKAVVVFTPGKPAKILGIEDTLDGGEVLPGFKLPVNDIFPE